MKRATFDRVVTAQVRGLAQGLGLALVPGLALGLAASAVAILAPRAQAARSQEFAVQTLEQVLEGELRGMAVTAEGTLIPAPGHERIFGDEVNYVWALAAAGDGAVYAATGSEGVLYRVSADGEAARLAETFEYELFSLARDEAGRLYVSGAPNGTIQRVSADGTRETLLDLPEGLVWDLVRAPDGSLYAATGESGEIYRVQPDGEATRVGRVPDVHVVTLAWWRDGLLCGTDSRGLLVWLDPDDGRAEILYDSSQEEVVAVLEREEGRLLFAANSAPGGQVNAGTEGLSMSGFEIRPEGSGTAVLYERTADGQVRVVWNCPEENILSLAPAPDGGILAGTGQNGVLYHLDAQWTPMRLLDLPEDQVLALATAGKRVFAGTGSPGSIYRLDWEGARTGVYETKVLDARQTADWGRPGYLLVGAGEVALASRSGQVKEAGDTWSEWAPLEARRIASPRARYLQLRVELTAPAGRRAELRGLRIPYRGPNRRPKVSDLAVSAKSVDLQSSGNGRGSVRQTLPGGVQVDFTLNDAGGSGAPSLDRAGHWARSLRTAVWSARDPDEDPLRYDLYLRRLNEDGWLALKRDLVDRAYSWDGSAWPEGWYELKVVARDEHGNPPGEGLTAEAVSPPFEVDNTPPRLESLEVRPRPEDGWTVRGVARDALSRIDGIEYSVNGEGWELALPSDGIFDASEEAFEIVVPAGAAEEPVSVIGVRAADEAGHLAVSRVTVGDRDEP